MGNETYTGTGRFMNTKDFVIENSILTAYEGDGTEAAIPEGVKAIGDRAFYGKRNLKSVTFPESLEEIGESAFFSCSSLETVNFSTGLRSIGEMAFGSTAIRELSLPEGVVNLSRSSFSPCRQLEKLTLPESLENIGPFAFSNCTRLSQITFNNGPAVIGQSAFSMCRMLTSVTLPETLEFLDRAVFLGCMSLKEVNAGPKLKEVNNIAFSGCSRLMRVNVVPENPYLKDIDGVLFSKDEKRLCYFPGGRLEIVIPEGVTEIGTAAFYENLNFDTISLPESLEKISDSAFFGCSELIKLDFPKKLKEVGKQSFQGCRKLVSLEFPDGFESMGETALRDCASLMWVRLPEGMEYDIHWFTVPNDPPAFSADRTVVPFFSTRPFDSITSGLGTNRACLGIIMAENAGILISGSVEKDYIDHIRENVTDYYENMLEDEECLRWMTEHEMIPADDIETLLGRAAASGKAGASALLLEYQSRVRKPEAILQALDESGRHISQAEQMEQRFSALENALDF